MSKEARYVNIKTYLTREEAKEFVSKHLPTHETPSVRIGMEHCPDHERSWITIVTGTRNEMKLLGIEIDGE